MTLGEIKEAALFQTSNDVEDIDDFRPVLSVYIDEAYDQLVFAWAQQHPSDYNHHYPLLKEREDVPRLPDWTHQALADWASYRILSSGNVGKQNRAGVFRGRFDEILRKIAYEGGRQGRGFSFQNVDGLGGHHHHDHHDHEHLHEHEVYARMKKFIEEKEQALNDIASNAASSANSAEVALQRLNEGIASGEFKGEPGDPGISYTESPEFQLLANQVRESADSAAVSARAADSSASLAGSKSVSASNYAITAGTAASNASTYASNAKTSASQASSSASQAKSYSSSASSYATTANKMANAASSHADDAQAAATTAEAAAASATAAVESVSQVNISASKTGDTVTVTAVDRNGGVTTVEIHDGAPGGVTEDELNQLKNDFSESIDEVGNTLSNKSNVGHTHATSDIVDGVLGVMYGGTGATSAADARESLAITPENIGAATSSHVHDAGNITSGTLAVANGGTGQTTLALARNAMGLGNTVGALPVANGGTGSTTAANARSALGVTLSNVCGDSGWLSLSGSYGGVSVTLYYRKIANVVTITCYNNMNAYKTPSGNIWTLPSGYRPKTIFLFGNDYWAAGNMTFACSTSGAIYLVNAQTTTSVVSFCSSFITA